MQLSEDPFLLEEWTSLCDKLDAWIQDHVNYKEVPIRGIADLLQDRVNLLRWCIPCRWHGLFNFVGDLASSIFGTPSATDLQALKDADEQLATAMEGVMETQHAIVTKVNIPWKKPAGSRKL